MTNFKELSETELKTVIEDAEKALKDKQKIKRKEVINQINELAASIGVKVEISVDGRGASRKGTKVPVKYINPGNPKEKWTGRGVTPKWLKVLLESGRDKSEFEIKS